MEEIGIKEIHSRILSIAKEFDRICTENEIPYYMLYGTMLGAVRHKGFIPWDDDMDFGVPITHYDKLSSVLAKELQPPFKACTYENHPGCGTAFIKIEDSTTIIDDPCMNLIPFEKQMGVSIDIFPLCYCEKNDYRIKKLNRLKVFHRTIFTGNAQKTKWKNIIKKGMQVLSLHPSQWYLRKEMELLYGLNNGPYMASLFGIYGERELIRKSVFGLGKRYTFEDTSLLGPVEYDTYLTQLYGDYLQLPPEDKRRVHCDRAFIK